MSGYECEDCGSYYGVRYGTCTECTPNVVKIIGRELENARQAARSEFRNKYKDREDAYVSESTKAIQQKYDELFNKYKPKEDDPRRFTRDQPDVISVISFLKRYKRKAKIKTNPKTLMEVFFGE